MDNNLDYNSEIRVLSPTAILGYGFPVESFEEGIVAGHTSSQLTPAPPTPAPTISVPDILSPTEMP